MALLFPLIMLILVTIKAWNKVNLIRQVRVSFNNAKQDWTETRMLLDYISHATIIYNQHLIDIEDITQRAEIIKQIQNLNDFHAIMMNRTAEIYSYIQQLRDDLTSI